MILKELVIEERQKNRMLTIPFRSSFTNVTANGGAAAEAIGTLLRKDLIKPGLPRGFIEPETEMRLELLLNDGIYRITHKKARTGEWREWTVYGPEGEIVPAGAFFMRIHQCQEEAESNYYVFDRSYVEVLQKYSDPLRFYSVQDFMRRTEGIGFTRTFRKTLLEMRREFRRPRERAGAALSNQGSFFEFNTFWNRIEKIRNMHFEPWPIIVLQSAEQKEDIRELTTQARLFKRQLIQIELDGGRRSEGVPGQRTKKGT